MNRGTFMWDLVKDDNEMLSHTRKIVEMRRRLRALRIGNYRALYSQSLMAFIRTTDKAMDTVIVLANSSSAPITEQIVIPQYNILGHTIFKEVFSQQEIRILGSTITVEVPPTSAL